MLDRLFILLGGLFGLAGVAASAAAAHVTGPGSLATAANVLLFHAPALWAGTALKRAGLGRPGLLRLGLALIGLGVILFSGDLALRALAGAPLFGGAAPTGGVLLMIGWLVSGLSGPVAARQ